MHQCQSCSFVAKNKAGFSAHTRACAKRQEESDPEPMVPQAGGATSDCPHCSMLPAGSVNLMSMFIVVIFCLVAVLFTAMYKIDAQTVQIQALQQELSSYVAI